MKINQPIKLQITIDFPAGEVPVDFWDELLRKIKADLAARQEVNSLKDEIMGVLTDFSKEKD